MKLLLLIIFFILMTLQSLIARTYKISGDRNYAPYSFIDEEGEAKGLLIDLYKEWAKVTENEVVFDLRDWSESIDIVKSKKVDLHSGVYRKVEGLYLAEAIYNTKVSLFSLKTYKLPLKDQKVGVIDIAFSKALLHDYPNIKIIEYKNYETLLTAIKNKEIAFFFDSASPVLWATNKDIYSETLELVSVMSQMIHFLQQERGASCGFVSSKGSEFSQTRDSIIKKVTSQKEKLFNYLEKHHKILAKTFSKIDRDSLYTIFKSIDLLRSQTGTLEIDFSKVYSKYTQIISRLILDISDISDRMENVKLKNTLYTYSTLLMHKESVGEKRAALSGLFSQKAFVKEIYEYFLTSDTQEKIYYKTFNYIASKKMRQEYKDKLKGAVLGTVNKYEKLALKKLEGKPIHVDPKNWFDAVTKKINLIQEVEVSLLHELHSLVRKIRVVDKKSYIYNHFKMIDLPQNYFFKMYPAAEDKNLLKKIKNGFDGISPSRISNIERKWIGKEERFHKKLLKNENAFGNKSLTLAVGFNRPPFMFGKTSQKGIEIDVATQALEAVGYTVKKVYQMSFNKTADVLLNSDEIDVAVTVPKVHEDRLYYSNPFLFFNNVAISRKSDNLSINNVKDLLNINVVAWSDAYKVLSPEYKKLFNPKSKRRTEKYKEIVDQNKQHESFFSKRSDVIIVDKTIFKWKQNYFKNAYDVMQAYNYHELFPRKTNYYVAFKNRRLRNDFNEGLKLIRKKGIEKEIYTQNIEGNIDLQLKLGNLVARIASIYIFQDDTKGLRKALKPFLALPFINDIDIYDSVNRKLMLHLESENSNASKVVTVDKKSYYRGDGNSLRVGNIKLSFNYEKVKNYSGSGVPSLELFNTLGNKEFHRIEKIYKKYKQSTQSLNLSPEEIKWIQEHKNVSFTGDPNWMPIEGFDAKGNYQGIASDHIALIEKRTGLKFDINPVQSWSETVQLVKDGDIDIISETTDSNLKKHLLFTNPYLKTPLVIVMDAKAGFVEKLEHLEDKKIALIKDYGYVDRLKLNHDTIRFINVKDIQEGLFAVSTGKIDAFICSLPLATYTISQLSLNNLKIVGQLSEYNEVGFGVRNDYPILVSILNKALESISQEEHHEIMSKWVKEQVFEKIDYALIWKILGGALVIFIAFFLWNRKMAGEIKKRKLAEEEVKASQARFSALYDASPDSIAIINSEGIYVDCNEATLKIFGLTSKEDFIGTKPELYSPLRQENGELSEVLVGKNVSLVFSEGVQKFDWVHKQVNTQEPFHAEVILSEILLDGKPHMYAVVRDITERKLLENTIKQNSDHMTFVSQNANLGFWNFNPQLGDLYVNDVFVTMLGYKPNDVLISGHEANMFKPFKDGLAFWEQLLHPDDAEKTGIAINAHINGETDIYKVDYRMRRADGSWMWSTAIGKIAEYDDEGKPIRFNGVNLDISEAKKIENEILEAKGYQETLLNSQKSMIISTNGISLKSVNNAFLKFYNVKSRDEFLEDVDCICDTFEQKEGENYLQREIEGMAWTEYVLEHINSRHIAFIKEHLFSVNVVKSTFNNEALFVAVFTDVTALENSQSELKLAMQTIENAPIDITHTDAKGYYTYVNNSFANNLGYSRKELIGKHITDINPVATRESIEEFFEMIRIKKTFNISNRPIKRRDGSIYPVHLSVSHATFKNEEVITSYLFDITDQVALQKELETTNKHVRDSIEYASLIQHSLIPDRELFTKHFQDSFAIWHPKDVVGGDIYLMEEISEDEVLLMVIDCTGHGVPGAFVSMLVKAIERQILANIHDETEISPAQMLAVFNKQIKHLLRQDNKDAISNAGFDGGILYYNKKEKIVRYAGSETPLYYYQNGEMNMFKGDRHSIGYKKSDPNFVFKDICIDVRQETQLFISTDGYFDQCGGEKDFPFGKKRYKALLEEYIDNSFADKQEVLLQSLYQYENGAERNDDVTIIGLKI